MFCVAIAPYLGFLTTSFVNGACRPSVPIQKRITHSTQIFRGSFLSARGRCGIGCAAKLPNAAEYRSFNQRVNGLIPSGLTTFLHSPGRTARSDSLPARSAPIRWQLEAERKSEPLRARFLSVFVAVLGAQYFRLIVAPNVRGRAATIDSGSWNVPMPSKTASSSVAFLA